MAYETMEKIVSISTMIHPKTGLLVAVSDDLKGLLVHGRSEAELLQRIPVAIRDILEAGGHRIESVEPLYETSPAAPPDFQPVARKYQARAS